MKTIIWLCALVFALALRVEVASARVPSGTLRTPAEVLAQTPTGARSVRFYAVDAGPGQNSLFCHIYESNKNFVLDVFQPDVTGALRRLNSVILKDGPHSDQLSVSFLWLQPKQFRGPILDLYDGDVPGDWEFSDTLLVFPDGFMGRVVQQSWPGVVRMGEVINASFDRYDERGLLVVTSWHGGDTVTPDGSSYGTPLYWNGNGFGERKAHPSYAIIGPLFKTRDQARAFLDGFEFAPGEKPDVQPSRYYKAKNVKSGLLVVTWGSYIFKEDAENKADSLRRGGIACSVVRLY